MAERFVEARKKDVDEPIAKRRDELRKSYTSALDNGIAKAASEGDLDTVLELKQEKNRIAEGEELAKEYESKTALKLLETYKKYVQQVDEEEANMRITMARQLVEALEKLQANLTKQQRFEDAIAVKIYHESREAVNLVTGEAKDSKSTFPGLEKIEKLLSSKAELVMSSELGKAKAPADAVSRIVVIPVKSGGDIPASIRGVAQDDRTDIVAVGNTLFPTIGATTNDGAMVCWPGLTGDSEIVAGSVIEIEQDFGTPVVGLNADGTLVCTAGENPGLMPELQAMTDVKEARASSGVIALVKTDGSVEILGDRKAISTAVFLADMSDVSDLQFSGAAFASVLKTDGSVIDVSNGTAREAPVSGITKLHALKLGETKDGELVSWGGLPENLRKEAGKNPIKVYSSSRRFAVLRNDHSFYLATSDDTGNWKEQEAFGQALRAATSFVWLVGRNEEWIVATLPAKEVSRSGAWEAEAFAASRLETE